MQKMRVDAQWTVTVELIAKAATEMVAEVSVAVLTEEIMAIQDCL
jgi:hypothetical protein